MKSCAFGKIRLDIRVFQDFDGISGQKETRVDDIAMSIGGSVFNTVSVLTEMEQDIVFYILNENNDLSGNIHHTLSNRNIRFVSAPEDTDNTSVSIIFVGQNGDKKMISYDSKRQDKYILERLSHDVDQYEYFYTSFYEITKENYVEIAKIMSKCKTNFIDLTPLIYELDRGVFWSILEKTQIVSGTEDEYGILFKTLDINSYEELADKFHITYLFVKKGSDGASAYYQGDVFHYSPREIKTGYDSTGCGDTFNAGMLYCLANGMTVDHALEQSVEMASRVAYEGLTPGMFRRENDETNG